MDAIWANWKYSNRKWKNETPVERRIVTALEASGNRPMDASTFSLVYDLGSPIRVQRALKRLIEKEVLTKSSAGRYALKNP